MAKSAEPAKLRFNCYLLRSDIKDVGKALRPKYRSGGTAALTKVAGTAEAPSGSVAYLGDPVERTPTWAAELGVLFPGVDQIKNISNRFVIFLPVRSRWFAICFGYGSGALEWDSIEANFGLRLAARRLRSGDVTEFRSRRIDASARTQSVQMPVGGDLRGLGVPLDGEFVRKLSGHLEDRGVEDVDGTVVAGDSIAFRATTDLARIQQVLEQMLEDVQQSEARDEFQFVDSLEPLRNSEEICKDLDKRLAREVLHDVAQTPPPLPELQTHVLVFAPPDDVRIDEVEDILVTYNDKRAVMSDFTIEELREALTEVGVRRGVNYLRGVKLLARGADGEERSQMLPLRNWLVFEIGDAAARFVLTLGRWFRLREDYTRRLNEDLTKLLRDVTTELSLPDTTAGEHEGPYNKRACAATPELLLLDKVDVITEDGGKIESCDILSLKGHLVHVKRYNGSQTLSHLFSQGAVSAELLNADLIAKRNFVDLVVAREGSFKSVADQAPQIVTYAIAIRDSYNLPLDLPTFSKVNLRDFARRLRRMRVEATIARIRVA